MNASHGAANVRNPPLAMRDVASWRTMRLDVCPYEGFWGFNPSILRTTDGRWLCTVRCANYRIPNGIAETPENGVIVNHNVLAELDPITLVPRALHLMSELDGLARPFRRCLGFEDLRLVETKRDGVLAIATAMQLSHTGRQEICVLTLDQKTFAVVGATPVRGTWSEKHQKNWTPYSGLGAIGLDLVYSIEGGEIVHVTRELSHGALDSGFERQSRWLGAPKRIPQKETLPPLVAPDLPDELLPLLSPSHPQRERAEGMRGTLRGPEIALMGRAHPRMAAGPVGTARHAPFPMRGGSQLVAIEPGRWLGVAHGMKLIGTFKFYWHVFYTMDDNGRMLQRSAPVKLDPGHGIEFCAGIAIGEPGEDKLGDSWRTPRMQVASNDRPVVLSYGIDDEHAMLGVTTLFSIERILRPLSTEIVS